MGLRKILINQMKIGRSGFERELTAVIWSYSFVVAHLKRVEDCRYVDVAKICTTASVAETKELIFLGITCSI